MRDLQDKFLVRAWLVDPTARIIPRKGEGAQAISLGEPNLLEVSSLDSTASGLISGTQGVGSDPKSNLKCVACQGLAGVVGTRGSLLVWQIVLTTSPIFAPSFGRCCLVRLWFRHLTRLLRGCESCCLEPPSRGQSWQSEPLP